MQPPNLSEAPIPWVLKIPGLPSDPHFSHVNATVLIFLGILAFSICANRAIKSVGINHAILPKPGFSFLNLVDVLIEALHGLIVGIVGHHGEGFVSFIGSIFIFVLFSNLFGLLPLSGGSPSSNVNTSMAVGLSSFAFFTLMGIRAHGIWAYLKHFSMGVGPSGFNGLVAAFASVFFLAIGIMVAGFEVLSNVIRPFTLGIRLAANMYIDHTLATAFEKLCAWIIPVPLLLFGVLVCTIQAFLFLVLTAVYTQMATEHEEDH